MNGWGRVRCDVTHVAGYTVSASDKSAHAYGVSCDRLIWLLLSVVSAKYLCLGVVQLAYWPKSRKGESVY